MSFLQGYGLTETSPLVALNLPGNKNAASIGCPASNTQIKVISLEDKQFKGLGPNQKGEICVRGPQSMLGYFKNPKATEEMVVDGWIRTGDLGHYDEEGFFYITDRLKELIKVKGFQVPPAELEELLRSHPHVQDAAVVGTSHESYGEVPRGFIVKRQGVDVSEKEIQEFVAEKVATYKQLRGGVLFLESIPKNASGKILRRDLKQKYCS